MTSPDGETIQGGTLFNGGQYRLEKGFDQFQFWREILICVVVILIQLYVKNCK